MSENYIGQIWAFAGNFAPKNNAYCDGQLMAIASNTALFSILGTTFGGDGKSTFALPDLQGRAPLHPGQGPGLTLRSLGEDIGSGTVALMASEMPAHSHAVQSGGGASATSAAGGYWGVTQGAGRAAAPLVYGDAGTAAFNAATLSPVGGGQPHVNQQPYQVISFVITLYGIFPPRN